MCRECPMEWFGDRHGGDLGTDLFGEEDSLLDGLGGEFRPVSRDQDVLEHYSFPPACAARRSSRRILARKDRLAVRSASPESAGDRVRRRPNRASTLPKPIP